MESRILSEVHEVTNYLHQLWEEIGFSDEDKLNREDDLVSQLTETMQTFYNKELKTRTRLLTEIKTNSTNVHSLLKELGLPYDLEDIHNSSSLIKMNSLIEDKIAALDEQVNKRIAELECLRKKERELAEKLSENCSYTLYKIAPSLEQIKSIEENIKILEQEQVHRELVFQNMKSKICVLAKELEFTPRNSFECAIAGDISVDIILSQSNIKKIKDLKEELHVKLERNHEQVAELIKKVRKLHDLLNIDGDTRDDFLSNLPISIPRRINVLEEEHSRLSAIRRESMKTLISEARNELETWWEKCYISEEKRKEFTPFYSEELSEDVLEDLHNENDRLRDYFLTIQEILNKLDKRQELWKKLLELNERSNDPNRLFGNRGCSLLQEEKQRKSVNLLLPKIEKELENLVSEYEIETGEVFNIDGCTVKEYIDAEWQKYNQQKEFDKIQRMENKAKEIEMDSKLGTLPRSSTKRKTQLRNTSKRLSKYQKTNNDENIPGTSRFISPLPRTSVRRETLRTSALTPLRESPMSRFSSQRNIFREANINSPLKRSAKKKITASCHDISSYSQFSEDLNFKSARDNVRSSMTNGSKTPVITHPMTEITPSRRKSPRFQSIPATLPRARSAGVRKSQRHKTIDMRKSTKISTTAWGSPIRTKTSMKTTIHLATPPRNRLRFLI